MKPPSKLDGADVVLWAWSEPEPFFLMPCTDGSGGIPIHGLAICRYADSGSIYKFSCDAKWEVGNDSPWDTVDSAQTAESAQYITNSISWQRWEQNGI